MAKKAIATLLLIAITAWAEMALAPMLAMHAGHMRPGHERAAVTAPQNAGHDHAGHHPTAHTPASEPPCCPGLHETKSEYVIDLVADVPGCDRSHSCCFRQGPQSVPAPARDLQKSGREITPVATKEIRPVMVAATDVVSDSALALRPYSDVFGMTLRV